MFDAFGMVCLRYVLQIKAEAVAVLTVYAMLACLGTLFHEMFILEL